MTIQLHRSAAARAAALFLLLCVLSACGGDGGGGRVYVGLAGPFSKPNGRSMKVAAEMAAAEINASGGIGGDSLVLVMMDDSASASYGVDVARRLRASDSVVAVVGHVNSGVSLKASEVYNAAAGAGAEGSPVVMISPASSAPELTGAGPWTFRVTPTDLEFSPALARWARERLGRSRAAVLYVNDDYGRGVRTTFERAFQGQGGTVVSADPYVPAMMTSDEAVDPYLARALRRGADALVIGGQADQGVRIVRAARRLGFAGPILGSDGMTGIKDQGAVGEGVFVSSAFLPDRDSEKARAFVKAYQERSGGELPDHRGAMTYDIVHLLRRTLTEGGRSREAVREYLERVGGDVAAYEGVSGTIKFDENGDVVGKPVTVGVVRGGRLVTPR